MMGRQNGLTLKKVRSTVSAKNGFDDILGEASMEALISEVLYA